jgi:hypothetical protein
MGAPPPTQSTLSSDPIMVWVKVRMENGTSVPPAVVNAIRAILEAYGADAGGNGTSKFGLRFSLVPDGEYSIHYDRTLNDDQLPDNQLRGKFLTAYEEIRERRKQIQGVYVNKWDEVAYGTGPLSRSPLNTLGYGGSEPARPLPL